MNWATFAGCLTGLILGQILFPIDVSWGERIFMSIIILIAGCGGADIITRAIADD